jgi:AAHS family 4-hydroxybenzoate transporter-like MFS transporter
VFYLGGILPLLIALLLIEALPESVRFLTARGKNPAALAKIMRQVAPGIREAELDLSPHTAGSGDAAGSFASKSTGPAVGRLFAEGRAAGTVLLWMAFFMNLLIMYFIVNWLPGLLQQSGLPASAGVTAILIFSLGGIAGNLGEGRVMNSCGAYATLLGQFAISTLLIGALAFLTRSFGLLLAVTFVLGVAIEGGQGGLNALAASFYPTTIRATGVGWALGVGRVGSIVAPMIGGMLLEMGWSPQRIFLAGMAPALCGALAILAGSRRSGHASALATEDAG